MKKRFVITLFTIAWGLVVTVPALAGDLVVTRFFSGLWDQTHHESQGIVLQVIDQEEEGNPKAVAYWFTYGDDLETAWYMAIGHVEGDQVLMTLYSSGGVGFMEEDSVEVNPVDDLGTLNLTFKNCHKGTAAYDMGEDMRGEFDISRLASLYNSRCSGGISDNTPGDAKPLMLEVDLLPPGDDMAAKGKAKFWERSDRSDFHVSVEGLVDGEYELHVCLENRGGLTVAGGEGAIQFRSPESEGKLNLAFDPRDCLIEIQQSDAVFLTSGDQVLGEKAKGPGDMGDRVRIQVDFENVSDIEGAEGEVEYEVKMNEVTLDVEISGLPMGIYTFVVDGSDAGSLEVLTDGEKTKLKFSDPQKDDWLELTFEPWGSVMEIVDAADNVLLYVQFPDAD
jgi:hypothetical protein